MKFEVYQIQLPEWMYNEINRLGHAKAAESFSIYKAHLDTTMGKWNPVHRAMYTKVATVQANSLEDVFRIGNIGPYEGGDESIEQHTPMHSISVGDLVRDEDGVWFFCERMGWTIVFVETKIKDFAA